MVERKASTSEYGRLTISTMGTKRNAPSSRIAFGESVHARRPASGRWSGDRHRIAGKAHGRGGASVRCMALIRMTMMPR